MILLVPFALFISIHFHLDLIQPLKPMAAELQDQCSKWMTHPTNPSDLSRSFICGEKVTQKNDKILLQKSGIYHAIVVSGGHFLFIDSVLKRLAMPTLLRGVLLLVYFLMTGLQAPGLRCLAQFALTGIMHRQNFKMSSINLCFISGLICLIISADLWNSLSFWLSFSVSMALCFTKSFLVPMNRPKAVILSLFLIYIFILPFNFSSGYLHPLNLILGLILIYPFCLVLLSSALLNLLAQLLNMESPYVFISQLHTFLFTVLKYTSQIIPPKNNSALSLFGFWVYLLILIAILFLATVYFRRETIRE